MTEADKNETSHDSAGTLKIGEVHPMASEEFKFVKEYLVNDLQGAFRLREAFASCAIEGNRTADVCGETLARIIEGKPVSDRYLLGLAWYLKMYGAPE